MVFAKESYASVALSYDYGTSVCGLCPCRRAAYCEQEFMTGSRPMFVAMSRFRIANGMAAAVCEAFRNRPHLADDAPGFIRMDVMSGKACPEEIRLITYWTDEESYRAWHHSHLYHDSHAGIPKGLKLVPGSVSIELFDHITS